VRSVSEPFADLVSGAPPRGGRGRALRAWFHHAATATAFLAVPVNSSSLSERGERLSGLPNERMVGSGSGAVPVGSDLAVSAVSGFVPV